MAANLLAQRFDLFVRRLRSFPWHGNLSTGRGPSKTAGIIQCAIASNLRDDPMPHEIKDALLIYNPTSGRKRHRRFAEIEQAVRLS